MSNPQMIFHIQLKKISFKQPPTSEQNLRCNLFYNNRKIDNTDPFQVPQNEKSVDLSSLKPLIFNIKEQENKHPICIYILYAQESTKKIILKRTDMAKKFDLQKKNSFDYNEDFGLFSVSYQVILKKEDSSRQIIEKKPPIPIQNLSKSIQKNQESLPRQFKRPSLLEVGQKAQRIRKNSIDSKQLGENSRQSISRKSKSKQSHPPVIPPLTIVKDDEKTEENFVKKDIKINLFENFSTGPKKSPDNHSKGILKKQDHSHVSHKESHHGQKTHENHHATGAHHQPQGGHHDSHHGSHHNSNHEKHDAHHGGHNSHGHGDHHDSHGHGHDEHDEHSEPLSLKLKTVLLMLIIGFLFLMYDALDERFSRKVRRVEGIHKHHRQDDNGHQDHHHVSASKKKKAKKSNKVTTH